MNDQTTQELQATIKHLRDLAYMCQHPVASDSLWDAVTAAENAAMIMSVDWKAKRRAWEQGEAISGEKKR